MDMTSRTADSATVDGADTSMMNAPSEDARREAERLLRELVRMEIEKGSDR